MYYNTMKISIIVLEKYPFLHSFHNLYRVQNKYELTK